MFIAEHLGACVDERAAIRVEVTILDRTAQALLRNLAIGGCMIECADDWLRVGDDVALQLDHNIKPDGRIVWHVGRYCGIRFEERIDPSILDRLGFKPENESDDFARRLTGSSAFWRR